MRQNHLRGSVPLLERKQKICDKDTDTQLSNVEVAAYRWLGVFDGFHDGVLDVNICSFVDGKAHEGS